MPRISYVRAAYEFTSPEPGEISLNVGDVVEVIGEVNESWQIGRNCSQSGQIGNFPKNFVEKLELPLLQKGQKVFLAVQSFNAQVDGDLTFCHGDLILGLNMVDSSWWKGKIQDRIGIFPLTFVIELISYSEVELYEQSKLSLEKAETNDCNANTIQEHLLSDNCEMIAKGKATMDFNAQLDDELSFKKDDIINIIRRVDDVFALGQIGSKIGQFPIAFIDILEGCVDTRIKVPSTDQLTSKFNWWKNSDDEKLILEKMTPSKSKPTPSFEEQTAPIVLDEEYNSLNTSHAFYTKPSDSLTEALLHDKKLLCNHDSSQYLIFANTLFKFSAENDNELGFEPGELIAVVRNIDDQWLEGEIGKRRGIFPASYVEILDGYDFENKAFVMTDKLAEYPHNSEGNLHSGDVKFTELTLKVGEVNDLSQFQGNYENIGVVSELRTTVVPECSPPAVVDCNCSGGGGISVEPVSLQNEPDVLPVVEANLPRMDDVEILKLKLDDKPCLEMTQSIFEKTLADTTANDCASNELMPLTEVSNVTSFNQSAFIDIVDKSQCVIADELIKSEKFLNSQEEKYVKNDKQLQAKYSHPADSISSTNILVIDVPSADVSASNGTLEMSMQPASDITIGLERPVSFSKCLSEIKGEFSSSSEMKPFGGADHKLEKPALGPKPKVKPKPNLAQIKTKSTEVLPDITSDVSKRHQLKKGVSFCLDNVIIYPGDSFHEKPNTSVKLHHNESHKKVEELNCHLPQSTSLSKAPEVFPADNFKLASTSSPTSPTTNCHINNDVVSVHFSKNSNISVPKLAKPPPMTSKQKMVLEKETKSEADSRKIGQSLFYGSASSMTIVTPPASPLSPKKLPPRPTRPKTTQSQGDTALPNGIFYTSLLDESDRPKPVPCRPAPARPSVVSLASSTDLVSLETSEDSSVENLDVIKDIERRIIEIDKDLENLQREELSLSCQLDDAVVDEKDLIKEKMEFCRANAVGLTEELGQLKDNLLHLRPNRVRLPYNQNADQKFARERALMSKKRQEEIQRKRQEMRARVIQEIIQTEHDYVQSILLCLEMFFNPELCDVKCPPGVDLGLLFGNIYEVVELSQKFINLLESNTLGKSFEEQQVGFCFEELKEELKRVYAVYCRNHDDVIMLLEKYESMPEVQEYFAVLIRQMRIHGTVFDVGSILIKPVQRILKYPLFLQELQKFTDVDHVDHNHLEAALRAMTDVATYINEFKRRKDLILKYKNPTDVSLRDMLSRLTVHSYKKKIGRISMMVAGTLTTDEKFSHEEMKFNALEEGISVILQNFSHYLDFLQKSLAAMETVANNTADYYSINRSEYEIDQLCRVLNCVTHTLFSHFKTQVQSDVLPLLNGLMTLLSGPQKLIKKRYHKLLDFENAKLKEKNVRDVDQVKMMKAEVQACKSNYEALNLQLLEDLPRFYRLSVSVIVDSLRQFVLIQEGFWLLAQSEISKLLKLKSIGDHCGGIIETFNIAHAEVVDHLSDLKLIPKSFNPLIDEKRRQRCLQSQENDGPGPESFAIQQELLGQVFPPEKLYVVTDDFEGTQLMDMKLSRGTVVGVIKDSDPMGNRDRFLVTDGVNKGFIPRRLLNACIGATTDENLPQCDLDSLTSPSSGSSSSFLSDFLSPVTERVHDFVVVCHNEPSNAFNVEDQISFQAQHDEIHSQNQHDSNDKCLPQTILYGAEYPYEKESEFEVSLLKGEIVKVLQQQDVSGNGEWWLVEKEDKRRGYVPAAFLFQTALSQKDC